MKNVIFVLSFFSFCAQADIVCKAATQMGMATIDISAASVTVSGAGLSTPAHFANLNYTYDGHMTSMITTAGLSITYESWYGCIHNVRVTTNFRDGNSFIESVDIKQCAGGSTNNQSCGVN